MFEKHRDAVLDLRSGRSTIGSQMLDLFEELRSVIARLDAEGVPYALCGGLAMAVHGYPRATVDIDIVVLANDFTRVEAAVRPLGFTLPAAPMTFAGGAVEIRRVSKIHTSGQLLSLDALLVTPTIEKAWQTRQAMMWDFGTITVVSREGLVALKSLRGSGRDQDDIKQLRGESE
jgi:hypothetical protein